MKVKATKKYEELKLIDNELGRMPKEGEEFEVSEERYVVLTQTNKFKEVFVERIEPEGSIADETKKEKLTEKAEIDEKEKEKKITNEESKKDNK